MGFTGKTTVITGAAQGLGRAIAEAFCLEGADIAIIDISEEAATDTATSLAEGTGRVVRAYAGDVGDAKSMATIAGQVEADLGRVDILVSNAGILIAGGLDEIKPDDWEKVIRVNLVGFFNVCRAFVPAIRKQRSGSIVQVNSKSGKSGSFKNSAYCASKFGRHWRRAVTGVGIGPRQHTRQCRVPGESARLTPVAGLALRSIWRAAWPDERGSASALRGQGTSRQPRV